MWKPPYTPLVPTRLHDPRQLSGGDRAEQGYVHDHHGDGEGDSHHQGAPHAHRWGQGVAPVSRERNSTACAMFNREILRNVSVKRRVARVNDDWWFVIGRYHGNDRHQIVSSLRRWRWRDVRRKRRAWSLWINATTQTAAKGDGTHVLKGFHVDDGVSFFWRRRQLFLATWSGSHIGWRAVFFLAWRHKFHHWVPC